MNAPQGNFGFHQKPKKGEKTTKTAQRKMKTEKKMTKTEKPRGSNKKVNK